VAKLDESRALKDPRMLRRCLLALDLTFVGFCLHEPLQLRPATIALAGAVLILLLTKVEIQEVLREIEWSTLLFFVGLFVLIASLVETGVIHGLAQLLLARAKHDPGATAIVLLWACAAGSAVVDNIPFVEAANPMLADLARNLGGAHQAGVAALHTPAMMALWWSLALGACLGGNATLIGASANVVVAGIAERSGHRISFMLYLRYGLPLTALSIALATLYVWLRYL
jgi:Na+/H+ antiporter NhaD/arsenite permease-like protein